MEQQGNDNNNTDQTQSMGSTDPTQIQLGQPSSDTAIPYGIPHFHVLSMGSTDPTQIQPGQPSSDTAIPYGIPHFHVLPPDEMTFDQMSNHFRQNHHKLRKFWAGQLQEVESLSDFQNHSLPLARIKKIMKSDEDVRMISGEVPVLFARACEMFILELTLRAWDHTEENKRRTLQKSDVSAVIARTDIFDFLLDIVPRDNAGPVNRAIVSSNPAPVVGGAYREVFDFFYAPQGVYQGVAADHGVCMHHHHHHHHHHPNEQPVYVEQRPQAYVVAPHLWGQLDQGEVLNEQEPQNPSNDY